jgi:hypothetical protein
MMTGVPGENCAPGSGATMRPNRRGRKAIQLSSSPSGFCPVPATTMPSSEIVVARFNSHPVRSSS